MFLPPIRGVAMFQFLKMFLKEESDPKERLREKFHQFRRLLAANNRALELMAVLEEEPTPQQLREDGLLYARVAELGERVAEMIGALNELSNNRYPQLLPIFQHLREELQQTLEKQPQIPETPYILPLQALSREKTPAVGAKMANLGEIRQRLGLPVPRGFAITAAAYQAFLAASGLAPIIEAKLAALPAGDLAALTQVSEEIQALILAAPLPEDLEAILQLTASALPASHFAVRSSAVGEDSDVSFAGQFTTLLNVSVEDLPRQYKQIIASKFSPTALHYWRQQQGFTVADLPMAVGVLTMVPARGSGVMFTADPQAPDNRSLIINAVWGLGKYAVDGVITPDHYVLDKDSRQLLRQEIAVKPVALMVTPSGGCEEQTLPPEQAAAPCLTPAQLQTLLEIGLALEQHFHRPQDVEWAVDDKGAIIILQTRPLRLAGEPVAAAPTPATPPEAPLLTGGQRAVGGVAAGPVFVFTPEVDLEAIPAGVVLVTRQPAIRLVLVLDRLNAIITEVGSPTDHLTIVAREFHVPAIVALPEAIQRLSPGQIVTVDADHTTIYPGLQAALLPPQPAPVASWPEQVRLEKYRQVLKLIVPLHLLDPQSPDFRPECCHSLHDLTRFCHEKAMDAMFALDVGEVGPAVGSQRLASDLPFNLFILDLGGGTRDDRAKVLTEADILSLPLKALLQGYHHPELAECSRSAPDLRGFISVFANTMYDAGKSETDLGGKSFAIISEHYLHFSSRLGYHFALVDAYLGPDLNDNYIAVQFKGGAASCDRRERRVRLLQTVLLDLGFQVQVSQDLVQARLVKFPQAESAAILEKVAILLAFCRQLDVALTSDTVVDHYVQAFRRQDYALRTLAQVYPPL
ncbi:MAG: PEP/pyruvate-binding domain-containing protein [Desulfobacca sp.]|uniref:PEP/pyruvate-binding domain-containing protein n=1 Tax=Desulfobacca sp. TaxID=2067990 RepID=UPI004049D444